MSHHPIHLTNGFPLTQIIGWGIDGAAYQQNNRKVAAK
jgi:hypothetical protein